MPRPPEPDEERVDQPTEERPAPAIDVDLQVRAMEEAPVGISIADATRPDMPLVYVNDAFERVTGYTEEYAIGRNCRFLQGEATRSEPVARMRSAIENEEAVSVELRNYRKGGDLFWNEVTLAPLRNEAGEVTHYVGFQSDVTRRKRAEQAAAERAARIEREREAQERLLDRLDGVVVDVTAAVTRAESRSDLRDAVVDRLGETYGGAWMGTYDPAADAVVVESAVGDAPSDATGREIPVDAAEAEDPVAAAVATAARDRTVSVEPLGDGGRIVAAVPLHYGDATYGIVCVYGRDGIDERERGVLAALGRTVATGINALESQRTLQADETVELQFTVRDDHPLVAFGATLGCRVEYVGSVADRERPSALFELSGVDGDAAREAADETPVDWQAVVFEGADGCLVELSAASGVEDVLADHGTELCDVTVEDGQGRITVEVARESLARAVVEEVTERFASADLVGYRRLEDRGETRREFVDRLEADLTDRQHAALVRAHTGGFFEWPHETTGEELADAMGVSRSTFHQHLRAAERKLVGAVLDRGTDYQTASRESN